MKIGEFSKAQALLRVPYIMYRYRFEALSGIFRIIWSSTYRARDVWAGNGLTWPPPSWAPQSRSRHTRWRTLEFRTWWTWTARTAGPANSPSSENSQEIIQKGRSLKGTVSWDFRPLVFSSNIFPWATVSHPKVFAFNFKFSEIGILIQTGRCQWHRWVKKVSFCNTCFSSFCLKGAG